MSYRLLNIAILICIASIVLSPLGRLLEATMVTHVLLELPVLFACGALLGMQLKPLKLFLLTAINHGGIFGILLVTLILAFWMIPRWLDASLDSSLVAYAKYASMLIAGILLVLSWSKAHVLVRAIVKIEFITMLCRLGWIYLISPLRLCNNYLLTDQLWLGRSMLLVGLALSISWLIPVFFCSEFGVLSDKNKHPLVKN